jgi:hypothetical protein
MPVEDPEIFSGWLQKRSGLALIQNLLFLDGHYLLDFVIMWKNPIAIKLMSL